MDISKFSIRDKLSNQPPVYFLKSFFYNLFTLVIHLVRSTKNAVIWISSGIFCWGLCKVTRYKLRIIRAKRINLKGVCAKAVNLVVH